MKKYDKHLLAPGIINHHNVRTGNVDKITIVPLNVVTGELLICTFASKIRIEITNPWEDQLNDG